MAITKNSSKSESWTIRIPNDLATVVRARFQPDTGNTQIVIESLKHLLGIDSNLPNNMSNSDLTEVRLELEEIRSRLAAIEQNIISNKSVTSSTSSTFIVDQDWMSLKMIADLVQVNPKSITTAISRRGREIGDETTRVQISDKIIHKKGKGLNALYQLQ